MVNAICDPRSQAIDLLKEEGATYSESRKNAMLYYSPRRFSQRGGMMPIAIANKPDLENDVPHSCCLASRRERKPALKDLLRTDGHKLPEYAPLMRRRSLMAESMGLCVPRLAPSLRRAIPSALRAAWSTQEHLPHPISLPSDCHALP